MNAAQLRLAAIDALMKASTRDLFPSFYNATQDVPSLYRTAACNARGWFFGHQCCLDL
jgi:hypothetical protein